MEERVKILEMRSMSVSVQKTTEGTTVRMVCVLLSCKLSIILVWPTTCPHLENLHFLLIEEHCSLHLGTLEYLIISIIKFFTYICHFKKPERFSTYGAHSYIFYIYYCAGNNLGNYAVAKMLNAAIHALSNSLLCEVIFVEKTPLYLNSL